MDFRPNLKAYVDTVRFPLLEVVLTSQETSQHWGKGNYSLKWNVQYKSDFSIGKSILFKTMIYCSKMWFFCWKIWFFVEKYDLFCWKIWFFCWKIWIFSVINNRCFMVIVDLQVEITIIKENNSVYFYQNPIFSKSVSEFKYK